MMREMISADMVTPTWKRNRTTNFTCIITLILLIQIFFGLYTHKLLKVKFQQEVIQTIHSGNTNFISELKADIGEGSFGNRNIADSIGEPRLLYRRRQYTKEATENLCRIVQNNCRPSIHTYFF